MKYHKVCTLGPTNSCSAFENRVRVYTLQVLHAKLYDYDRERARPIYGAHIEVYLYGVPCDPCTGLHVDPVRWRGKNTVSAMSTPSLKSRAMFLFGRDSGTVSTHAYRSCIILVRYLRGSVGMRTDPALYSVHLGILVKTVFIFGFLLSFAHASTHKFNMTLLYACCLSHTHIHVFYMCGVFMCAYACHVGSVVCVT